MNGRDLAITILVGLLIVASSIAVYQQVIFMKTTTTTVTLATTQTVTLSTVTLSTSEAPVQLLGSRGFIHIISPNSSASASETCLCFYYIEANGTNSRLSQDSWSFPESFPFRDPSVKPVNFTDFTPRGEACSDIIGCECLSYKVTFQDSSSENLGDCSFACGASISFGCFATISQNGLTSGYDITSFNFTKHTNPQAGLALSASGTLFFLVSE
jgi:hypothetical protein